MIFLLLASAPLSVAARDVRVFLWFPLTAHGFGNILPLRIPGPALLGFLFLIPGTLVHMFSDPGILASTLRLTALFHILPLGA